MPWRSPFTRSTDPVAAPAPAPAGVASVPGITIPTRPDVIPSVVRAMSLPAVYRALTIISGSVAQLTLQATYGGRPMAKTPALLQRPDQARPLANFLKRTAFDLAAYGNAFWRRETDASGRTTGLRVLDPASVSWTTERGSWRWTFRDLTRPTGLLELDAADVLHLRLLEVPGAVLGLGPLQACGGTIAGALGLRQYSTGLLATGGIPTGVLTSPDRLDPVQANAIKERWEATVSRGGTAVLGSGMSYAAVSANPAQLQWLESQQQAVQDVARMFGIPPSFLGVGIDGSSLTYANVSSVEAQLLRYTLLPYLAEIEAALTSCLPAGQAARFDVSGWLRPDPSTRADIASKLIPLGVLTPQEARQQEGLA